MTHHVLVLTTDKHRAQDNNQQHNASGKNRKRYHKEHSRGVTNTKPQQHQSIKPPDNAHQQPARHLPEQRQETTDEWSKRQNAATHTEDPEKTRPKRSSKSRRHQTHNVAQDATKNRVKHKNRSRRRKTGNQKSRVDNTNKDSKSITAQRQAEKRTSQTRKHTK
ncbi:hypothetical protein BV20DRAFT_1051020 [Pilatotrama ljubarskyi]|nr:hypothetical protein BV20DRAFT_1051020 [Pilatotrama ljubarskyi]